MKTVNAGAVATAQYLLGKFKFVETKPGRFAMYFDHQLPPARTLIKAIKLSMEQEGLEYPSDELLIEITPEQAHNISFMLKLFTAVDPVLVDGSVHYHHHITKLFDCRTQDAAAVIAQQARYVKPTSMDKFKLYDGEEVYACLHTALRKLCDSKITSAAWNAFQNLSGDARRWVCEPVEQALKGSYETIEAFEQACKTACMDAEYMGVSEKAMVHCMYELFSADDWSGYLGYLYSERKAE
jgi:hypothetical protein